MSRLWKTLAVLFVGLPLWFLAWRGYDEWRVRSAYKRFLVERQQKREALTLATLKELSEWEDSVWDTLAADARTYNLRHPREWAP